MKALGPVLLAVLVAGCEPAPEWIDREGWIFEGDLEAVPPYGPETVDDVLAAARAVAPCEIEPWGGWIEWRRLPFYCNGDEIPDVGCFVYRSKAPEARITLTGFPWYTSPISSPLAHELGHYVEARCLGETTEAGAERFAAKVYAYLHPGETTP